MATAALDAAEPAVEAADNDAEQQSAPRDFEAEARSQGWTPKEEFKGDPSRWVDAEPFVTRVDEIMPLLKQKTKVQDREILALKKAVQQQARLLSTADERAMTRAIAELKTKQEAAVESGDLTEFRAIDKEIDKLKSEAKAATAETFTIEQAKEAYADWRLENTWYDKGEKASGTPLEADARAYADALTDKHAKDADKMAPADFFAMIGEKVHEKFPALTGKAPRAKPASDVSPPTNGRSVSGTPSFTSLPRDAQQTCDKLFRMGALPGKDLNEARAYYAKNY